MYFYKFKKPEQKEKKKHNVSSESVNNYDPLRVIASESRHTRKTDWIASFLAMTQSDNRTDNKNKTTK